MNRNDQSSSNRVRGPTSALTSFLREQGINIQNRSRRARRESALEETATEESQETAVQQPQQQEEEQADESVSMRITTRSSTKKRKKDNDDGNDGDEDIHASSSSRKVVKGRTRIFFCAQCKSRFARDISTEEASLCDSCKSGNSTKKSATKPKRKRLNITKKDTLIKQEIVPSLQDICISIIAEYIDEVEAFGVISDDSFEKLSKIICRNRKLTDETSRLFMESYRKTLKLYDCTNMSETALMNIAHFCPNLEKLDLIYCGQIHDKVLSLYQERLHHLKTIYISGGFLITKEAWISFFETIGTRLESFGTRHTNRFNLECIKSLVTHCPNIQILDFGQIIHLTSDWFSEISKLKKLTSLTLAWPSTERPVQETDLIEMLEAVGPQLTELSLRGFKDFTDKVLLEGVMKHCRFLKKINLELCDQLTAEAVIKFFDTWEGKGLTHLDLSRCILVNDDALKAIVRHSGNTLTHLNIHSLELLTPNGLEVLAGDKNDCRMLVYLNCGFVRAMDDFVLKKLITRCRSLQKLLVSGCHLLTNSVKVQNNSTLRIIGRETN